MKKILIVLLVASLACVGVGYTATPWYVGDYPCVSCKFINDAAVLEEDMDERPFSAAVEVGDTFIGSSGTVYELMLPTSQPPEGSNAEYIFEWTVVPD